jgi:hypothetical protein
MSAHGAVLPVLKPLPNGSFWETRPLPSVAETAHV